MVASSSPVELLGWDCEQIIVPRREESAERTRQSRKSRVYPLTRDVVCGYKRVYVHACCRIGLTKWQPGSRKTETQTKEQAHEGDMTRYDENPIVIWSALNFKSVEWFVNIWYVDERISISCWRYLSFSSFLWHIYFLIEMPIQKKFLKKFFCSSAIIHVIAKEQVKNFARIIAKDIHLCFISKLW